MSNSSFRLRKLPHFGLNYSKPTVVRHSLCCGYMIVNSYTDHIMQFKLFIQAKFALKGLPDHIL